MNSLFQGKEILKQKVNITMLCLRKNGAQTAPEVGLQNNKRSKERAKLFPANIYARTPECMHGIVEH